MNFLLILFLYLKKTHTQNSYNKILIIITTSSTLLTSY